MTFDQNDPIPLHKNPILPCLIVPEVLRHLRPPYRQRPDRFPLSGIILINHVSIRVMLDLEPTAIILIVKNLTA